MPKVTLVRFLSSSWVGPQGFLFFLVIVLCALDDHFIHLEASEVTYEYVQLFSTAVMKEKNS